MGILRLSHVDIKVPDMDLAKAYYTGVMGLDITEEADDRVFCKCWDEEDHHSMAVRYDPRAGMDRFTFKVEREDDLDELESAVETYGFHVTRVHRGDEIGQGESIRFETPSGHEMELVHDVERVGGTSASSTPTSSPRASRASPLPGWTTCSSTPRRSVGRPSSTWTSWASG